MKKVVIFDAYGTLFDVNAAARNYSKETADINFINTWEKVSKLWRDKQIAYTWYYNSIGYKTNFWKVTEDSLDKSIDGIDRSISALLCSVVPLTLKPKP